MKPNRQTETPLDRQNDLSDIFSEITGLPQVGVLAAGVIGTALAAACYPIVILVVVSLSGDLLKQQASFGFVVTTLLAGFPFGVSLGFLVGGLHLLLIAFLANQVKQPTDRVWLASLIGGWTGFFCTYLFLATIAELGTIEYGLVTMAVVLGQAFAALFAHRKRQQHEAAGIRLKPEIRFGLKHLLAAITIFSLGLGGMLAIGVSRKAILAIALCGAWQVSCILFAKLACRFRNAWRST